MSVSVLKAGLLCHRLGARNPPFNAFASDPEWRTLSAHSLSNISGSSRGTKTNSTNPVQTARRVQ
jgi:hypothetical protein